MFDRRKRVISFLFGTMIFFGQEAVAKEMEKGVGYLVTPSDVEGFSLRCWPHKGMGCQFLFGGRADELNNQEKKFSMGLGLLFLLAKEERIRRYLGLRINGERGFESRYDLIGEVVYGIEYFFDKVGSRFSLNLEIGLFGGRKTKKMEGMKEEGAVYGLGLGFGGYYYFKKGGEKE